MCNLIKLKLKLLKLNWLFRGPLRLGKFTHINRIIYSKSHVVKYLFISHILLDTVSEKRFLHRTALSWKYQSKMLSETCCFELMINPLFVCVHIIHVYILMRLSLEMYTLSASKIWKHFRFVQYLLKQKLSNDS